MTGPVRVRVPRAADATALHDIAAAAWSDDPVWSQSIPHADQAPDPDATTVATVDGEPVGFAVLGDRAHHHRFLKLAVGTGAPTDRVVEALVSDLRRRNAGPMVSRIRPWHHDVERALRRVGFVEFERAASAIIDPESPELAAWASSTLAALPESQTIASLDEHVTGAVHCLWDWYLATHSEWSSDEDLPADVRRRRLLGPAIARTGRVVVEQGRVIAAGSLWDDPLSSTSGLTHLAMAGSCLPPNHGAVVAGLYAALIRVARSMGRRVQIEVSDRYPDGYTTFGSMPIELRPELVILGEPLTRR